MALRLRLSRTVPKFKADRHLGRKASIMRQVPLPLRIPVSGDARPIGSECSAKTFDAMLRSCSKGVVMVREGGSRPRERDLDLAGFAQEFLRRDPAYVRDYRGIMRGSVRGPLLEQEEMAHSWGLSFSVCAGNPRVSRTRALAAGCALIDGHTRCGADRVRRQRSRYHPLAGHPDRPAVIGRTPYRLGRHRRISQSLDPRSAPRTAARLCHPARRGDDPARCGHRAIRSSIVGHSAGSLPKSFTANGLSGAALVAAASNSRRVAGR